MLVEKSNDLPKVTGQSVVQSGSLISEPFRLVSTIIPGKSGEECQGPTGKPRQQPPE